MNNGAESVSSTYPERAEVRISDEIELMEKGLAPEGELKIPVGNMGLMGMHKVDSTFTDIRKIASTAYESFQEEPISVERIDTSAQIVFESHIDSLTRQLFDTWDLDGDGIICEEEIAKGTAEFGAEFSQGFARCLDHDESGHVHLNDIINTLKILKLGTMDEKVKIIMKFIDRDKTNSICYEEAEYYLKSAPKEICRRLGIIKEDGSHGAISYNDLLALFRNSDRGEDAVNIFCGHILTVLESKSSVHRLRKSKMSRMGSVFAIAQDSIDCSSTLVSLVNRIPKSQMFLVALVLLQMALWAYNFNFYWKQDMPVAFCFAKGCGLNLRILTIILFLSMARTTMGYLYEVPFIKSFIPMGFNIQIHSFLGFSTVLHAFGHMFGHIVFHTNHVEGGMAHAFLQKSLLRGADWHKKGRGDAITGFILLGSLLFMAFTALNRGGSAEKYKLFSRAHYLYNAWIVFVFLHVPHLWPYFVFIGGIMLLERSYDFIMQTKHHTLSTSRPCGDGVTFFSVPRAGSPTYPGAYYRIKVPSISAIEWHPFSLAGSMSSHMLTFFIASAGDWTKELYRIVEDPVLRNSTAVMVQGPFYAPAHAAIKDPTASTLLVASGIGITPFFSIMATKVTDEQSYESDRDVFESLFSEELEDQRFIAPMDTLSKAGKLAKMVDRLTGNSGKPEPVRTRPSRRDSWAEAIGEVESPVKILRVVWSIREVSELMFYVDYVCQLVKHQQQLKKPAVHVDIYLTGLGKSSDLKYMMSQTLFLLTLANRTSNYMKIHFGRPDMDRIVRTIRPDEVYYCGGKFLKDVLADLCTKYNTHFHPEDFDSGAHLLPRAIKKISGLFSSNPPRKRTVSK